MTHNTTHIEDRHEGDAFQIPVVVRDSDGDRVNLTGANVEWLLKESSVDTDDEAILHKQSDNGDDEVEITSAIDGEAIIKVQTGDTDGLLTQDDGTRVRQRSLHHRCRIEDYQGRRSTVFHGDLDLVL